MVHDVKQNVLGIFLDVGSLLDENGNLIPIAFVAFAT